MKVNVSKDHIVAYVSPRSIGGQSLFSPAAKLMASHIESYTSEKSIETRARNKLEAMGFTIEKVSTLSIRISAPAALYQKEMGVKFEKDTSSMFLPTPESVMNALQLDSEVLEGAAFPQPVELHAAKKAAKKAAAKKAAVHAGPSATPPALPYFHLQVPDDIVSLLNAGPLHAGGIKGQGVKAAMIDSGFDWSHPYFSGKGYNLNAAPPHNVDRNGHGTGESANLLAIAPKVKLHGLLMDDSVASFQTARDTLKVKIISNSWGSRLPTDGQFGTWNPYWSLVLGEISLCVQAGMIVLFSGGNGGMSATASSTDVISVGGVYSDENGQLHATDYASSFQSFRFPGRQIPDVCGLCGVRPRAAYIALPIPPGCAIDQDLAGGIWPMKDQTAANDGWAVFSGTSAACPMVAGVVALMLSKHPDLTLAEIRQRLESTCKDVVQGASSMGDQAGPGRDLATGYGLVDAARACA
ncbi:S8 family serine peptidase [Luteolibacter sp. Populi]|uniref:S8 family serine peptidase n=1 Tax=Luteolibacter sp. Populi TaxID=3230487 RepID=UPI0034669721